VLELVRASGSGEHRIERIKDTPVLRLRDKLLPLISLEELLRLNQQLGEQSGEQPGERDGGEGFVVITQVGSHVFGIVVDGVFHTEEIVIKPMSSKLRHIPVFSGTTILGDGTVIMVIDPNGISQALGRAALLAPADGSRREAHEEAGNGELTPLLVFRAGSPQPKAVLLSLVARLEEIDCSRIENADGCRLVQYREQLMPLLSIDRQAAVKQDGAQPVLVFSDRDRSMGLIVDEIVDIVEQKLDIEVASERPGVLGYAVVKGSATEIIDVGHFLPQAFADWFLQREPSARIARKIMLVDDSVFFRDLLAPLIKAAGYQVAAHASATQALAAIKAGARVDIIVTDVEMPDMDGFEFAMALRKNPNTAAIPIIALSAMVSTDAIERGRRVGFHDFVAKFDRAGLIAAIKEQSADLQQAA
jgi:two-component system chemotaxis sensor kinase CheA